MKNDLGLLLEKITKFGFYWAFLIYVMMHEGEYWPIGVFLCFLYALVIHTVSSMKIYREENRNP